MGIVRCAEYLAIWGIISFIVGRLLPKKFSFDKFPFASFKFENNGKIYKKIGISKWQSKVPDMSRIFKKTMPAKKIENRPDAEKIYDMIQETCIAEMVHFVLIFCGIRCFWLWPGKGGAICFLLNLIGNAVFIVIQRYNRPRFVSLLKKQKRIGAFEERKEKPSACLDFKL